MKHKASTLKGTLLDTAVAMAEKDPWRCWVDGVPVVPGRADGPPTTPYRPSSNWADGGPIIERERIALEFIDIDDGARWDASMVHRTGEYLYVMGPTPLIAAMRCYVMSRLGDEIELPEGK